MIMRNEDFGGPETVVVLADTQIPYHNQEAIDASLAYIHDIEPHMVILLGDILDFPTLTTKFLRKHTDPNDLVEQLIQGADFVRSVHLASPDSRMVFIEGNHEARLVNYITECAPELEALTNVDGILTVPGLLIAHGAPDTFEYVGPYGEVFLYKGYAFKHGDVAGPHPAAKELAMEGTSGMSGHVHRFQQHTQTNRSGAHQWTCTGALCNIAGADMPPGYRNGRNRLRDWQIGLSTVYFAENGTFNVYTSVITDGTFTAPGGIEYGASGRTR
jgi:UDP-2,3-diacylglucosamine pyrophosphatase LpxH